MYYPVVGERVWVSGCCDEFIVEHTDYTACVAVIAVATGRRLENTPFRLLFAYCDFEGAQAGASAPPAVREVLRSSELRVLQVTLVIRALRETIDVTLATIRRSRVLISESDRVIACSRALDWSCDQNGENSPGLSPSPQK
ncbi:MAG TPA: hypothetical protein VGI45_00870 [Terracidiphilus sp.]